MTKNNIWRAGAALSVLALTACVSSDTAATDEEAKPFIDPLILSQSMCSGKPVTKNDPANDAASAAASFDYGEAFPLPTDVKAHFHYEISTESPEAQDWFDTGLVHMANFNHDEAIAAFRTAQALDPDCAMCFWGEGFAIGSNINVPYETPRGAAGLVAANAAMDRLSGVTDREAALIGALSRRYAHSESGAVTEQAGAFADAMDIVATQYPADKFILSLSAEANMDTQPWDYWEAGARIPKGRTARTLELIESALKIDGEFAPAIHLYIHITESSVDPFRAERFADRMSDQNLGIGHLVHMPSHIYLRLGKWKKSHASNVAAIEADESYIANSKNAGVYAAIYYPHNVHFVVASSQFAGDAETSTTMAAKLAGLGPPDPSAPAPFAEHVFASEIFTKLLFASEETVLDIPEPAAPHLYMRNAWHYTRGTVLARQGDLAAADAELTALSALTEAPGFDAYSEMFGVPLPGIVEVARLTLEARLFAASNDLEAAIDRLETATEIEGQIPYFEPTWWYYPTRQTLGMYLLMDRQFDRAEREFYKTLIKAPNNAYALYGLAETYRAKGDARSEAYARELFDEAWMGAADARPKLDQL